MLMNVRSRVAAGAANGNGSRQQYQVSVLPHIARGLRGECTVHVLQWADINGLNAQMAATGAIACREMAAARDSPMAACPPRQQTPSRQYKTIFPPPVSLLGSYW